MLFKFLSSRTYALVGKKGGFWAGYTRANTPNLLAKCVTPILMISIGQAMLKMGSIAIFQEMILEGTGPQVDRQFAVFVLSGCKVSFDELNGTLVNPRKFFNPQANDLWVYFKAIVGVRMISSDISL
jgi:hypothetical protein